MGLLALCFWVSASFIICCNAKILLKVGDAHGWTELPFEPEDKGSITQWALGQLSRWFGSRCMLFIVSVSSQSFALLQMSGVQEQTSRFRNACWLEIRCNSTAVSATGMFGFFKAIFFFFPDHAVVLLFLFFFSLFQKHFPFDCI